MPKLEWMNFIFKNYTVAGSEKATISVRVQISLQLWFHYGMFQVLSSSTVTAAFVNNSFQTLFSLTLSSEHVYA